jgi:hypothetical protein
MPGGQSRQRTIVGAGPALPLRSRLLRLALAALLALGVVAVCGSIAFAQADGIEISLHRVAGYSLGSQVRGAFELRAEPRSELESVEYTIDGAALGKSTEPPFSVHFTTGDYEPGWREIRAEGRTRDGLKLASNVLRVEIVHRRAIWLVLRRVVAPGGAVLGVIAVGALVLSAVGAWRRRESGGSGRAGALEPATREDRPGSPRALTPEQEHRRRVEDSRYTQL